MITVDKINEIKQEINILLDSAYNTNDYGIDSTLLVKIKKSSFDFVMNQIIDILNEV